MRNIVVEYTRGGKPGRVKFQTASPTSAVREFNRYMQQRRKAGPDDYRITRIHHDYVGTDDRTWIESDFDLPGGPNMVIGPGEIGPAEDGQMALFDEQPQQTDKTDNTYSQ